MTDFTRFAEADRKFINRDTIDTYCNNNIALIGENTKVTGMVLEFPGLGGNSCLGGNMDTLGTYDNAFTRRCAENGLVAAYMFPGPWSWMNRGAVRVTDLVIDAIADRFGLEEGKYTLVVMGGSMGGYGALMFSIGTRHKVTACLAHCPCCDPLNSFAVHPAFPRTYICAVNEYDMSFEDALKYSAPVNRIADMPKIPYFITADEHDECFFVPEITALTEKMRDAGLDVTYLFLPGQPHGGYTQEEREKFDRFVFENSGK